jgi:hypothetical protein
MKSSDPLKTLRFIIKNEWLVDSILFLGSGFITHLAYQNSEIEPELFNDIRNANWRGDILGEIVQQSTKGERRIAKIDMIKANVFDGFIRFDFRLLEVKPFLRNGAQPVNSPYLCFYTERR